MEDTDPSLPDKERRKVLLDFLNGGRNQARHANDPDETHFDIEQVYPLQMIMRAMAMARGLGARIGHEAEMVRWIHAHPEATK